MDYAVRGGGGRNWYSCINFRRVDTEPPGEERQGVLDWRRPTVVRVLGQRGNDRCESAIWLGFSMQKTVDIAAKSVSLPVMS